MTSKHGSIEHVARRSRRLIAASMALLLVTLPAVASAQGDALPDEPAGHLARILEAGRIVMATDPLDPPQSFLDRSGDIVGFDIDVGGEIAERLGVELVLMPVAWSEVTAGDWAGRFDMSVGSMGVTRSRMAVVEFTRPYYATAAQVARHPQLSAGSLDEMAGMTFCVGEATTHLDWLEDRLELPSGGAEVPPPDGARVVTRPSDRDCAEEWGAGFRDFQGWISAAPTVQRAIDDGLPVVAVGEPIFVEPLAVAFDRSVEDNDQLVAAVDAIVAAMHEDGTLSELSLEWYGEDLSRGAGELRSELEEPAGARDAAAETDPPTA